MKSFDRVAVLIPVHNEADTLPWVLQRLQLHLPGASVVVVDSGCTDSSTDIAINHGASVVKALAPGYWQALQTGYQALLERDLDAIVQLDGDGQHNPADAPRLSQIRGCRLGRWKPDRALFLIPPGRSAAV